MKKKNAIMTYDQIEKLLIKTSKDDSAKISELQRALDGQGIVLLSQYNALLESNRKLQEYNSSLTKQLSKSLQKNSEMKLDIHNLNVELNNLRSSVKTVSHNARGAGRKHIDISSKVLELRKSKTIKDTAIELNVGIATVKRVLQKAKLAQN